MLKSTELSELQKKQIERSMKVLQFGEN